MAPLAALIASSFTPAPAPEPPIATVLCYHTFDSPKKTPYTVTSRTFEEQMRFLSVQRIPVIPLQKLMDHLRTGAPIPEHSVVVTIDDGYKTARTKAWPILQRYGYPFTLFVYPQFIDHAAGLTWEDLHEMAEHGVDIESHSLTHPLLTHPGIAMSRADYRAWVDRELQESKRLLEQHLHKRVTAMMFNAVDQATMA